jgi:hypothetical protein
LSRQCSYIRAGGERCRGVAIRGSALCAAHHPDTQVRRRAGARRGGQSHQTGELSTIKAELRTVVDGVLDGRIERGVGSCAAQLYNVLLRAVEVERKVRESAELEARLEALEGALRNPAVPVGGEARWRA